MTAPDRLDVLAVHAEAYSLLLGFGERKYAMRVAEANNAIRELIEADREYDEAHVGFVSQIATAEQIERVNLAWRRRAAALAALSGVGDGR